MGVIWAATKDATLQVPFGAQSVEQPLETLRVARYKEVVDMNDKKDAPDVVYVDGRLGSALAESSSLQNTTNLVLPNLVCVSRAV